MSKKKKKSKEVEVYNERVWLNDDDSPSTGSIVCYHGPASWYSDEGSKKRDEIFFVEVSDCHVKARLHAVRFDTMDQFRAKVRGMRDALDRYLDHLEGIEKE